MKLLISIFITFTIALRPALPLVDYVVNYDYIVSKLCENKSKPEIMCNGKCYLSKELAQSSQTTSKTDSTKIVTNVLDSFLDQEKFNFNLFQLPKLGGFEKVFFQPQFYSSSFTAKVFHPPLI